MADPTRGQRLQVMLTPLELMKVDDWRYNHRMPSRAAAIRALLKLGLASVDADLGRSGFKSQGVGVGSSKK